MRLPHARFGEPGYEGRWNGLLVRGGDERWFEQLGLAAQFRPGRPERAP